MDLSSSATFKERRAPSSANGLHGSSQMEQFKSRVRFVVVVTTSLFLAVSLTWIARAVLLLMFAAILCSLLLTTASDWMQKTLKVRRSIGLTTVVLGGVGTATLGLWIRGAAIAEQFVKLQSDLPAAAHKLFAQLRATDWGRWLLARLGENAHQTSGFTFAISHMGGAVLTTASVVGAFVILSIASLYLAAEPETYLKCVRFITPGIYRKTVERCLTRATMQLRWWLLAKMVSMLAVGVMVFVGLWILQVPLAGTLSAIAACLTFIPNVGPILSAVPAGLLAFAASPFKGMGAISLFCLVHFIEGNFVTPLAERRLVKLPPAITLAVQLLLASTTGALGIALAAPLTAAMFGIAQELASGENSLDTDGH